MGSLADGPLLGALWADYAAQTKRNACRPQLVGQWPTTYRLWRHNGASEAISPLPMKPLWSHRGAIMEILRTDMKSCSLGSARQAFGAPLEGILSAKGAIVGCIVGSKM